MRRTTLLAAAFAALLSPAQAQETLPTAVPVRVALVIGNQDYAQVDDLPNAARDAADMATLLRQYGFEVYEGINLDRRGFERLIRDALLNLPLGSEVVFFYAGHGIQIGARNYLLPTDAAFASVNDLPVYAITLDRVVEALAARGSVHVVFIDACRENPFPGVKLSTDLAANIVETGQGFSAFPAPLNSLVAFSTSPGQTAMDGPLGTNSPYTGALLQTVSAAPDSDLSTLLPRIRERVYTETGGAQVPWESSTLVRPFQFAVQGDGSFITAPVVLAQETVERSPAPVVTAITAIAPLDRMVDLAPRLFDIRQKPLENATVTALPANGEVAILDGGAALLYRPALREIRSADLASHSHTDRLTLETGPEGARETVTVDIALQADPCDVLAGDALDLQGVGLYRLPNEIDAATAQAACRAAVTAHPDTPRFQYQLGRAQLAAADFTAAYDSFHTAAQARHTRALTAEATLLLSERIDRSAFDVPQDSARAIDLLEQGIAAGDPFAIHARGLRLLRSGTTTEDRQRGFELLDRAAELGHTYSMNELGVYFLTKDSDHYQPDRGMTYLRESYARNDIYGMHNLGFVALYGLDGQLPDPARAAPFFEAAAAGGHPKSPATLGRMVMRDQLGPADHAKAVAWYDMGLARGDGWGGANAAEVILLGRVPDMGPPDAAARAAKAMLLPDAEAAAAAEKVLSGLNRAAIDGGLQTILRELGQDVAVDGAAGPATRAALDAAAQAAGVPSQAANGRDRLLLAARLWWQKHPARTDLY